MSKQDEKTIAEWVRLGAEAMMIPSDRRAVRLVLVGRGKGTFTSKALGQALRDGGFWQKLKTGEAK